MTKITCILSFVLALLCSPAVAQHTLQPDKYWIYLADKVGTSGKVLEVETNHLSEHALERRALRGSRQTKMLDAPLSADYLQALADLGIQAVVQSRWLNAISATLDEVQRETVQSLPFVREVRTVGSLHRSPAPEPSTPPPSLPLAAKTTELDYGSSFTQLDLINAIPPLENGINGAGVILGFLDTTYEDFTHPVFARLVSEGRLLGVRNFAQSQTDNHGMRVASVAVGFAEGQLIGPGWGASVLAATTEYAPTETNQEEDNFVAGLEWLEANGVDVVNTSLGYRDFFDAGQRNYTNEDLDGDTGVTTRAVDIAASLGVVVVTSAGNEGSTGNPLIGTPADADTVITVGGVNASGSKVSFSSIGPTADGRIKPEVAALALGVRIAQSGQRFTFGNGTSFAAPIVAGVVTQMLQVNPSLTPVEVREILIATASQSQNPDNNLGWGVIDAEAAINQAILVAGEEPVVPDDFAVIAPYPNPFSQHTVLQIHTPAPAAATVYVYNVLGQRVATPFDGMLQAGTNDIVINARSLPSGLYLYRVAGSGITAAGKMVLLR